MSLLRTAHTIMLSPGQSMTIGEDGDGGYWLEVQNGEEAIEARLEPAVALALISLAPKLPGLKEEYHG